MHSLTSGSDTTKLFTQDEAAARLGLSKRTLSRWRYQRTGPDYVKRGRSVFYDADALAAFERTWTRVVVVNPPVAQGGDDPR